MFTRAAGGGLVVLALLSACTRDEAATVASTSVASTTPPSTAATPTSALPTSAPPTSIVTTAPPTTAAPPTTPPPTTPPTTTPATTAPTTLPPFPISGADFSVTNETWAVVLAGSPEVDDPTLDAAIADAAAAGYVTGPTDCDFGAKQALGFSDDEFVYTISVFFLTESDARTAAEAFSARGIPAVAALLQVFCLD